jgi:serine/threonine-protein kinase
VALDYIVQICEGLAEAHAIGIVHRDLKPSNLFVTRRPDGSELIKILDFGISKWSQGEEQLDELTQTGVVLGSPKYMAPEQLFGSASVDARADVWSIGAIFYEMLCGRPPFDFPTLTRICAELATDKPPPSLKALLPDLPDGIEAVVLQCFARDRDHRMNNVATFAGALLDAVDAPFAGQVRAKIQAVLDPKASRELSGGTSSGGMPLATGNYRSLSLTGSGPRLSSSGAIQIAMDTANGPSSSATGSGVEASVQPNAEGKKKALFIGVGAGVVIAIGAFLFWQSSRPAPEAVKPAEPPTRVAPAAQPAPPATSAPAPTVVAAPVATAPPAPPSSAASPETPGNHAAPAPVWHGHHASVPHPASPPPAAPPAPAASAAPAPAPPPAPAPQPTTKANPLEDRQ